MDECVDALFASVDAVRAFVVQEEDEIVGLLFVCVSGVWHDGCSDSVRSCVELGSFGELGLSEWKVLERAGTEYEED